MIHGIWAGFESRADHFVTGRIRVGTSSSWSAPAPSKRVTVPFERPITGTHAESASSRPDTMLVVPGPGLPKQMPTLRATRAYPYAMKTALDSFRARIGFTDVPCRSATRCSGLPDRPNAYSTPSASSASTAACHAVRVMPTSVVPTAGDRGTAGGAAPGRAHTSRA